MNICNFIGGQGAVFPVLANSAWTKNLALNALAWRALEKTDAYTPPTLPSPGVYNAAGWGLFGGAACGSAIGLASSFALMAQDVSHHDNLDLLQVGSTLGFLGGAAIGNFAAKAIWQSVEHYATFEGLIDNLLGDDKELRNASLMLLYKSNKIDFAIDRLERVISTLNCGDPVLKTAKTSMELLQLAKNLLDLQHALRSKDGAYGMEAAIIDMRTTPEFERLTDAMKNT